MNRKAKLEKALAFNRWFFNENTILYNNDVINDAERHHKNCLSPLHEALIAAVEALEMGAFHHPACGWYDRKECHCANSKCKEALSKIDKVLETK